MWVAELSHRSTGSDKSKPITVDISDDEGNHKNDNDSEWEEWHYTVDADPAIMSTETTQVSPSVFTSSASESHQSTSTAAAPAASESSSSAPNRLVRIPTPVYDSDEYMDVYNASFSAMNLDIESPWGDNANFGI